MAIAFPGGTEFVCSPLHGINEFACFEGDDSRKNVQEVGDTGLDQINELIAHPTIDLECVDSTGVSRSLTCPLNVTFGGDQAMQGSLLCMTYCNSCNPCPLCEVSSADMCCTDLEKLAQMQPRSQERIELLAHSRCGTCPACKKVITVQTRAKEGDKDPKGKDGLSWSKLHKGVTYGAEFLVQLPIGKWILCILHANLTQTAALWERTLRCRIGDFCDKDYTITGILLCKYTLISVLSLRSARAYSKHPQKRRDSA
jgi:hypothetical protein